MEDVTLRARVFCGQLLKVPDRLSDEDWDLDQEMIGW